MTPGVESAFKDISNSDAVRYVDYWGGLAAETDADLFERFLFAFMSVHTTWESNVRGFKAIREFDRWIDDDDALEGRLRTSGAGLYANRTRFIGEFGHRFWADPSFYRRRTREAWPVYRDRLEADILGLGPAKVSFALEMAFPLEAEVLCLDVHMLRLYGRRGVGLRVGEYERMEADWVARSRAAEIPAYIVKQVHWDNKQGKPDSRYWSYVLE
jgi:hypothetical protein